MTSQMTKPVHCIGREEASSVMAQKARESGAVLLFGGRQAGKTTILRRTAQSLGEARYDAAEMSTAEIPVYVDLMRLPPEAVPSDVFSLMLSLAEDACLTQIVGHVQADRDHSRPGSLDVLLSGLEDLVRGAGEVDVNVLFLFDEAQRILGNRFPRGFHDNLFALLYGSHAVEGRCRIVFAGAQDLYAFEDDDTSPIASRAARQLIGNLSVEHCTELIRSTHGTIATDEVAKRAAFLFNSTGGHAGTASRLARRLAVLDIVEGKDFAEAYSKQQAESWGLFEVWREAFSPEARLVHDLLLETESVDRPDVLAALRGRGLDPAKWNRAREELVFTGIATMDGERTKLVNLMYAEVAKKGLTGGVSRDQHLLTLAVPEIVGRPEDALVERKSSLRWDYRRSAVNGELELVVSRTVAAFQNSDSGCVVLGVDDAGKVLGLSSDYGTLKRKDRDGFEQHLVNILCRDLGKQACTRVQIEFCVIEDLEVCALRVRASERPVYVRVDKDGKKVTEFWVRAGNTKQELTTEEAVNYVLGRWPDL